MRGDRAEINGRPVIPDVQQEGIRMNFTDVQKVSDDWERSGIQKGKECFGAIDNGSEMMISV